MKISRVGVDLAKNVFHVHAVDGRGKAVWQGSLRRSCWLREVQKRVPEGREVGMEACARAHHWARQLRSKGYRVPGDGAGH